MTKNDVAIDRDDVARSVPSMALCCDWGSVAVGSICRTHILNHQVVLNHTVYGSALTEMLGRQVPGMT